MRPLERFPPPGGLDMNEDRDQKASSEGGDPPNGEPMRRRRSRKLSGMDRRSVGDLAFALYEVSSASVPDAQKWGLLKAKLLAWRALYL